jgi:multidrug efflux system membrane fusion protein
MSTTGWVVGGILIVAVGGGVFAFRHSQATSAAKAKAAATPDRAVPVVTAIVQQKDTPIYLEGLGSVSAFYTVTVKTLVDGRLESIPFTEGQYVKKGDLLAQIDPRPFEIQEHMGEAALARDEANLREQERNLVRFQELVKGKLIAQQQVDDQQAMVDQLKATTRSDQATIDQAKLQLTYAHITSPIDGRTGIRLVDPGNVIHAADTTGIVVITQLDPIAVLFTLAEDDLPEVSREMAKTELTVDAFSRDGKTDLGLGKVALVDNQINQATGTIRIKAIFPNPAHQLWPNQFVKARLHLMTRPNAITVPAAVVQRGPQGTFAYVIDKDNKASVRPITVDLIEGDVAIISSGLEAGEVVVTDGQYQLAPGSRVLPKAADTPMSSGDMAIVPGASSASTSANTPPPAGSGGHHHGASAP